MAAIETRSEDDYVRLLEARALAEYTEWIRRLELERWTTSGRDPDAALRDLIRREGAHTARQIRA